MKEVFALVLLMHYNNDLGPDVLVDMSHTYTSALECSMRAAELNVTGSMTPMMQERFLKVLNWIQERDLPKHAYPNAEESYVECATLMGGGQ